MQRIFELFSTAKMAETQRGKAPGISLDAPSSRVNDKLSAKKKVHVARSSLLRRVDLSFRFTSCLRALT